MSSLPSLGTTEANLLLHYPTRRGSLASQERRVTLLFLQPAERAGSPSFSDLETEPREHPNARLGRRE